MTPSEVRNSSLEQTRTKAVDFAVGTYATGGLAVSPKSFGMSNLIGAQVIGGNAASIGYHFTYDTTNKKLLVGIGAGVAHSHALLLKNAAVADGATTRVNAGTNLLGANTGGDLTVAGGGANGGVQSATPANGALAEVANGVDLSAITVRLMGIGF